MASTQGIPGELVAAARALLRFQGELGLSGLDLPDNVLRPPAPAPVTRRPEPDPGPDPGPERGSRPPWLQPEPRAPAPKPAPARASDPLAALRAEMGDCRRCKLASTRTSIVFGAGNPNARLMFVGEAPGFDEDLQGIPFVGAAGKLLDRMIVAMGLGRRDVYIANVLKCRPPRNRDPEPDEVAACAGFLQAQIRAVQPEVVVTLGRPAAQLLLQESAPIGRLRGRWREHQGIPVMPTFHPAYLLRNEEAKRPAWQDLKAVMKRLGLPLPPAK